MKLLPILATAAALLLAGCIESDEKIVLNPDGSGKALVKIKVAAGGGIQLGDEKPAEPEQVARETAASLIGGAKGVEAWSDVKYGVADDGRVEFGGVAYFPDITKFSVGSVGGGGVKMGGDEAAWEMAREGGMITLTYLPMGGGEEAEDGAPATEPPADIDAVIKKERMEFQQGKAMMAGFLGGMKTSAALQVPGEILESSGFKRDGDSVSLSFTGTDLLNGMEKVMQDDELMRRLAKEGRLGDDSDGPPPEVMRKIFGEDSVKVRFKAGEPRFDYKAEVAKALANPPADLEKLIEESKKAAEMPSIEFGDDDEDKPAGDPDPGFEAAARKHIESLPPTFKARNGTEVRATVHGADRAKNDGSEGSIVIDCTLSDGKTEERIEATISFSKGDVVWKPNGFSSGGLPDFLGEGLEKIRSFSDWVNPD